MGVCMGYNKFIDYYLCWTFVTTWGCQQSTYTDGQAGKSERQQRVGGGKKRRRIPNSTVVLDSPQVTKLATLKGSSDIWFPAEKLFVGMQAQVTNKRSS